MYTLRKELIEKFTDIFHTLNIRYFISSGNLLEHTRGKFIYPDGDIDFRIHPDDRGIFVK